MLDITAARALLARTRPARGPDGYPTAVRSEVTELARHLVAGGCARGRVARDLGLHRCTLDSWLDLGTSRSSEVGGAAFVPVVVSGPDTEPRAPEAGARAEAEPVGGPAAVLPPPIAWSAPPLARLTVVTPKGFRLEGLDFDGAITALGRLG